MPSRHLVDYAKLNSSILKLDSAILASSIAGENGKLLAHNVKKGSENEIGLNMEGEKYLGSWISVMVSVSRQSDKFLTKMEYIKIGRKKYNGLLVPIENRRITIRLSLEKEIDAEYMVKKLRAYVKKFRSR